MKLTLKNVKVKKQKVKSLSNEYFQNITLKKSFVLATAVQMLIVGKQLKMEGFLVNRYADRTIEGVTQNLLWAKEGKLKSREHLYHGFDRAVDAFIGLFRGENTGKSLVKV